MEIRQFELGAKNIASAKVVITKEKFETLINEVYLKQRKNITLPGFRRGKAQRKMIEKFYGERIFWDDAINDNLEAALEFVITEKELKPAAQPWIDKADYNEDSGEVEIELSVPNYPVVELGQYLNLSAFKPDATVDEFEVDAQIESVRERNGSIVTCDRPANWGDVVIMDYVGYINGAAFQGGKGENCSLELGSRAFVRGFEEGLIGASAEEDREISLTFPAQYHVAALQNEDAVFKVHVHEVKEKILPELDDDFAKDVSEFDTFDEYRGSIRKELQESADKKARDAFLDNLMDQIVANAVIDLHESLIEKHQQELMVQRASRMGIDLETYRKVLDSNSEFTKAFSENAEKNLRTELCLAEIGKRENVELTDEDKTREYAELAERYGVDAESVKTFINTETFERGILLTKIADVIIASAVPLDTEPLPAKKPKPKQTPKVTPKRTAKSTFKPASESAEKTAPEAETAAEPKSEAETPAEPKAKAKTKTATKKKTAEVPVAEVPAAADTSPASKPKTTRKPGTKKTETETAKEETK